MTLLTEQELMDRTTSMKDPNRQPRTHADEPTNTWLKSLSIVEKFKLNKEIREKNSERRKKTLEHKREPAKPAGSPTASYVTITDEEWQHVQSSKSLFDRVKEFASDKVLTVLEKSMSEKEKGKDAPAKQSRTVDDKVLSQRIVEKPFSLQPIATIPIPRDLKHLHNIDLVPLGIFSDENLAHFNDFLTQIPVIRKLDASGNKTPVLDLNQILSRLDLDLSDKFDALTFEQFGRAAVNFTRMIKEMDPDGAEGVQSKWAEQHFAFFLNQADASKTYEWERRKLRFREHVRFDLNHYHSKLE